MAVTDFREGAYVNGIVCDGCTVAIPLLTLRYFCRQCYDEHPASGGADYCMECVQPGVVVKTTVHSAYVCGCAAGIDPSFLLSTMSLSSSIHCFFQLTSFSHPFV